MSLSIYQNVFDWANQEGNLHSAMKIQCGLFEVEEDFTYIIVIFRNKCALIVLWLCVPATKHLDYY